MAISDNMVLVLEEARGALAQQREELTAVRGRSSALLTLAGLAAAFLGTIVAGGPQPASAWTYASTIAFGVVVVVVVFVNFPRTFTFSNDAAAMLDAWSLDTRAPDDTAEHLARYLAQHASENSPRLNSYTQAYVVGLVAFVAEVIFLFLGLRGGS